MDTDDLFVVERLDSRRSLCVSTLARQSVTESEALHLGGDCGLFIYEVDDSLGSAGVHVLAKATCVEAALRLIDLWRARSAA